MFSDPRKQRWYDKHGKEYYRQRNNTEQVRAYKRAWKKRNPDYYKKHWQDVRERVFSMYGSVCVKCGFADKRALQLDHVKNDGYKDRWRNKDGRRCTKTQPTWYDALKKQQPEKYQILCANCNWIKRYDATTVPNTRS